MSRILELFLAGDVGGFNAYREKHPDVLLDLSEIRLEHKKFSGINLSGVTLTQCVFVECDFSGADFSGARLYSYETSKQRSSFYKCNLSGVELGKADCRYVLFVECTVDAHTRWFKSQLAQAVFVRLIGDIRLIGMQTNLSDSIVEPELKEVKPIKRIVPQKTADGVWIN